MLFEAVISHGIVDNVTYTSEAGSFEGSPVYYVLVKVTSLKGVPQMSP